MSEALRVEIAGVPLVCKHCGADDFYEESAALDRLALGGVFHLEGIWGHQATIYVCSACGFLHWFFATDTGRHRRTEAEEAAEMVECLACGQSIPAGALACPACGWSWETPEAETPDEAAEGVECLSCRQMIPAGASACPECGWSWESDRAKAP